MNIEVLAFSGAPLVFTVNPRVSISRFYAHLADSLSLKNRHFFGLQVYNEWHQTVVWMKPSDTLSVAIKKGMRFKPLAVRFYLRAHTFPTDWNGLRDDTIAIRLFFKQISERFIERGYLANSGTELALLALEMLAQYGPLVTTVSAVPASDLLQCITRRLVVPDDSSAEAVDSLGETVLRLWNLFGPMTAHDAAFNYISIITGAGYNYETVRFMVKNVCQKKPADLGVSFGGLELFQPADDGQTEMFAFSWADISAIEQRKKWITLRLADAEPLVFQANCQFVARRIDSLIKAYHGVYLGRKSGGTGGAQTSLVLPHAEQFFAAIQDTLMPLGESAAKELGLEEVAAEDVAIEEVAIEEALQEEEGGKIDAEVSNEAAEYEAPELEAGEQLSGIIEKLAIWIESNADLIAEDESLARDVEELYQLASAAFAQLKSPFNLFDDSTSYGPFLEQTEEKSQSEAIQEMEDKEMGETAVANAEEEEDVDPEETEGPSDYELDDQTVDELQFEEVAQEEERESTQMVAESVILQEVTDTSVDLLTEAKEANSSSMDELISDHSADYAAKNSKLALFKSLSLRSGGRGRRRQSAGSKMVSIEQVKAALESVIEEMSHQAEEITEEEGVMPMAPISGLGDESALQLAVE